MLQCRLLSFKCVRYTCHGDCHKAFKIGSGENQPGPRAENLEFGNEMESDERTGFLVGNFKEPFSFPILSHLALDNVGEVLWTLEELHQVCLSNSPKL